MVEGVLQHDVLTLIKVRCTLFATHQLDLLDQRWCSLGTHHALGRLCCSLVAQQEPTTRLEEIGNVLDVELEVVNEHLENMEDCVGAGDLELRKLSVETDVLSLAMLP